MAVFCFGVDGCGFSRETIGAGCACSREKCDFTCLTYSAYMGKPQNNVKECKTKQTNADRIRQMPDEKLAEWLIQFSDGIIGSEAKARNAMYHGRLLEWLREDVET